MGTNRRSLSGGADETGVCQIHGRKATLREKALKHAVPGILHAGLGVEFRTEVFSEALPKRLEGNTSALSVGVRPGSRAES